MNRLSRHPFLVVWMLDTIIPFTDAVPCYWRTGAPLTKKLLKGESKYFKTVTNDKFLALQTFQDKLVSPPVLALPQKTISTSTRLPATNKWSAYYSKNYTSGTIIPLVNFLKRRSLHIMSTTSLIESFCRSNWPYCWWGRIWNSRTSPSEPTKTNGSRSSTIFMRLGDSCNGPYANLNSNSTSLIAPESVVKHQTRYRD